MSNDTMPEGPNPSGLCMCGCGQRTLLARRNVRSRGQIKGAPARYIHGHNHGKRGVGEGPNPGGLCLCGCGGRTAIAKVSNSSKGHVAGTPMAYLHGHGTRLNNSPCVKLRIETVRYRVDPLTGCWNWLGYVSPNGYAMMSYDGYPSYAHRVYYEQERGVIPEGLIVHHKCANKRCVNPLHLRAVDRKEHYAIHKAGGRQR